MSPIGTVCANTKCYIFGRDRVLTGAELLGLQGMDVHKLVQEIADGHMSDALARDLAGNSFSGSIMVAFMLVLLAHWPHPRMPSDDVPTAQLCSAAAHGMGVAASMDASRATGVAAAGMDAALETGVGDNTMLTDTEREKDEEELRRLSFMCQSPIIKREWGTS